MAQIDPERTYHDWLVERVVEYLQTGDARLFPFTAGFDEHQRAAFARDLREGLAEVIDSGAARKTSATGFMASDHALRRVIEEWQAARGGWPEGSYPFDPVTGLGSSSAVDAPSRRYPRRVIRDGKTRSTSPE